MTSPIGAEADEGVEVGLGLADRPVEPRRHAGVAPEDQATVVVVDVDHDEVADQDGQAEQQHHAGDEGAPGQDRHPAERHARRAERERRGDHADGAEQQRHHDEGERQQVQVDGLGVATAGAAVGGIGRDHQPGADQPAPERQCRGPAEGDAVGADLQRHDGDGQAEQQGEHADEHQPVAVEAEQLDHGVELHDLRACRVDPLHGEQGPHDQGGGHADERHRDVHPADALVIGRHDPPGQARGSGHRAPSGRRGLGGLHLGSVLGDRHRSSTCASRTRPHLAG